MKSKHYYYLQPGGRPARVTASTKPNGTHRWNAGWSYAQYVDNGWQPAPERITWHFLQTYRYIGFLPVTF